MLMVCLSYGAIAIYAIAFPLWCIRCVLHYSVASHTDALFFVRYRFLFANFSPEARFFSLVLLLRNLAVSLISVFMLRYAVLQITCMSGVMVLYIAFQARCWPWAQTRVNVLDSIGCLCIFGVMAVGVAYIDQVMEESERNQKGVPRKGMPGNGVPQEGVMNERTN